MKNFFTLEVLSVLKLPLENEMCVKYNICPRIAKGNFQNIIPFFLTLNLSWKKRNSYCKNHHVDSVFSFIEKNLNYSHALLSAVHTVD